MRRLYRNEFIACIAATLMIAAVVTPSTAQTVPTYIQMEEPVRWTQEDVTPQQKYTTATKEAIAAQQESIKNCQVLDPAERTTCVALARQTYREEMALIRAHFNR